MRESRNGAVGKGTAVAPFCPVAYIKIKLNQLGLEENLSSLKQPVGFGVCLENPDFNHPLTSS